MIEALLALILVLAVLSARTYAALRAPRIDAQETRRLGRSRGWNVRSMRPGLDRAPALLAAIAPRQLGQRIASAARRANDAATRALLAGAMGRGTLAGVGAVGMVHTSGRTVDARTYATLQLAATAAAGQRLILPPGTTYTFSEPVTIPADTIVDARGATLDFSGANAKALILSDGCKLFGGTVTGPGATYAAGSIGIFASGTRNGAATPPTRISGLHIHDVTITDFGSTGIEIDFAQNVRITGCTVDRVAYAGVVGYSVNDMRTTGCTISNLTGETASGELNAYGITYTSLTGAGVDTVRDPVSTNCRASENTLDTVPTWHGIDTHGGDAITITGNTLVNCRRGIILTNTGTTSPKNCFVAFNTYTNDYAESATNSNGTEKRGEALWDIGVSAANPSTNNTFYANHLVNAGTSRSALAAIYLQNSKRGNLHSNTLVHAYNCGILLNSDISDYVIKANVVLNARSVGIAGGSPTDNPSGIRFAASDTFNDVHVTQNEVIASDAAIDTFGTQIAILFGSALSTGSVRLLGNQTAGVPTEYSGLSAGAVITPTSDSDKLGGTAAASYALKTYADAAQAAAEATAANASNLSSGTIPAAQLPAATTGAIGALLKAAALTAPAPSALTDNTGATADAIIENIAPTSSPADAAPTGTSAGAGAATLSTNAVATTASVDAAFSTLQTRINALATKASVDARLQSLENNDSDLADAINKLRARLEDVIALQVTAGQQTTGP